MNGDQAVARILKKEGVEWIAAFPAQSLIDVCALGRASDPSSPARSAPA